MALGRVKLAIGKNTIKCSTCVTFGDDTKSCLTRISGFHDALPAAHNPKESANARRTLDESRSGEKKNIAPSQNIFTKEMRHSKTEQEPFENPIEFSRGLHEMHDPKKAIC